MPHFANTPTYPLYITEVASESWDDDFLWQHSSSSDLHLPSSTSRHHQRHSHYRDKRLSTASSSSEHYAPRTQVPYHAQARPHRKASSLSTSTMGSVFTQDEEPAPPLRTRLSRSTSSSHAQQDRRKNWASLSTTSLQEEEDEPTITLATIASRQTGTAIATLASSKTLKRPSTSPSPSSPSINSRPSKLVPPSPSFFRTVSSSSWRSTTPSLASDTYSATQTYESASATETDNETAEEGDKDTEDRTGNWEHLSLSPESQMLTASAEIALGQGSTSRRKRGRGNTFGATTPRLALSALFGSPTLPGNTTDKTENDTPPKRLGASLFRRSSRLKKMDTPSTKATPDIRDPTFGKVRSRSPIQPVSGQQTPVTSHRELSLPHGNNEEKTVRARQSTGASHHSTSTFLFLASPVTSETATHLSPGRPTPDLDRQTSFERTPKSSNATKGSSDYCHRYSGISYDSSLSDRLRFQVDEHEENTKEEHPLAGQKQDQEEALIHGRFNVGQDPPYENVQHLSPLSPSMVQQPDRSTTSLISNQSSATFTSTFSNDSNRAELARTASMPRRKLKKARPKTADSGLTAGKSFVTTAESDAETRLSNAASKSPSERASETLTPSFVFPAPSPRSIGETSEAPKAKVEATNNASGLTTWSTSSKKNGGIGSSLRRRVSRKRLGRVADESSADEGGYLTPARGSSAKTSTTGLSPNTAVTSQLLGSSSSLENSRSAFASRATIRQFSLVPTTGSQAHGQQSESLSAHDGNLETNHLPSASLGRSTHLLAGLSKRISRDFKINKSSSSAPKRTESVPFGKPDACGGDIPLLAAEETAVITSNAEVQVQPKDAGLQLDASFKKHRRPLSLSGFLSRSTGPLDSARSRSRSSTLTGSNGLSLLSHSVDSQILEHDIHIPAAPLSASAIGGFRRPSGFLHRSTASSGNIPTARVITESSGK